MPADTSPDSQADRIINGERAEVNFSTLWQGGFYRFQQLRDQYYTFAVCLGMSPFDAHCWVIPKTVIMAQWGAGNGLESQHGGQARKDTAWLSVVPGKELAWLRACGGRLQHGRHVPDEPLPPRRRPARSQPRRACQPRDLGAAPN